MKRSDMQWIVSQAQEELKEAGKDPWNLSLLSGMTGISRPTLRKCRDEGFHHEHGNKGKKRRSKLSGRFGDLVREKLSKGVTNSAVIYADLRKIGYPGKLTIVKDFIARNRHLCPDVVRTAKVAKGNRGRRYKLDAGDCFQMDWGFVNAIDAYGKVHKLACFVMVCGHCGKRYIEFFTNARQENLFIGMLRGFWFLGGIPRRVMTDNMKSVCTSRHGQNILWNGKYRDFMQHLGFATTLCRPRHAFTKGRVLLSA
ncbi:MAG: transposase [Spirochaetia bacterium]|nr:transposase [Spirochaetia bacterium]